MGLSYAVFTTTSALSQTERIPSTGPRFCAEPSMSMSCGVPNAEAACGCAGRLSTRRWLASCSKRWACLPRRRGSPELEIQPTCSARPKSGERAGCGARLPQPLSRGLLCKGSTWSALTAPADPKTGGFRSAAILWLAFPFHRLLAPAGQGGQFRATENTAPSPADGASAAVRAST